MLSHAKVLKLYMSSATRKFDCSTVCMFNRFPHLRVRMSGLTAIKAPIRTEMAVFQEYLKEAIKSEAPLLDRIMQYILKTKGKQVRPILVLLAAKAAGIVNELSYNAAALIEILHTATLVHDDVVDEADQRRGFFSINALWKNKIAILSGDYLLSKGLLLALNKKNYVALHLLADAVKSISEAELRQLKKSRTLDIKQSDYFKIIEGKTASLFASSCAAGAASVTDDPEVIDKMKQFGLNAGMAFQMKDDLFDYGRADVGKPLGIDIEQKKMTLPLIYTLENASSTERRKLMRIVKKRGGNKEDRRYLVDKILEKGGVKFAEAKMLEYKEAAIQCLIGIRDSDAKKALLNLVEFIVNRKK